MIIIILTIGDIDTGSFTCSTLSIGSISANWWAPFLSVNLGVPKTVTCSMSYPLVFKAAAKRHETAPLKCVYIIKNEINRNNIWEMKIGLLYPSIDLISQGKRYSRRDSTWERWDLRFWKERKSCAVRWWILMVDNQ